MRRKPTGQTPHRKQESKQVPKDTPPSQKNGIPWLKYLLVAAGLCIISLLAYSNSFRSGFVFDNRFIILDDPRLSQVTANNVDLILQHTYWWPYEETNLYRPVTTLSYLFNDAVLGEADHPAGYHWVNFFLQALNVLLLFALALRLVGKFWPSAFIAGLWAVHPVLTESVTNIVGRADLLSAAALLSGFLFYLKSTETEGRARFRWLVGLAAVTAIGVFSKESAVAIVGVIALYEFTWWKERRQLRRFLWGCAAMAPAFVALFYQRWVVLSNSEPSQLPSVLVSNPLVGAHFWTARLTSIAVMGRYLWLLVWPAKLSCDYSYNAIPLATGNLHDWIDWIVVAVVVAAMAWAFKRNKLVFFFGAFAFVTFLPMSNLLFPAGTIMAERFLYLPAAAFAVCLVLILYAIGERLGQGTTGSGMTGSGMMSRAVVPVVLCLIIVALGVRTWARNLDWQDDVTLWSSAVQTVPASFKAHISLAFALAQSNLKSNMGRIIDESEKALAILNPLPDAQNYGLAYAYAGSYYLEKGDIAAPPAPDGRSAASPVSLAAYQRAQQILTRGIAIDQATRNAYVASERARGKRDSEIPISGFAGLYETMAEVSLRLGDSKAARDYASYARELDGDNPDNYRLLASLSVSEGHNDAAAVMLMEGLMVTRDQRFLEALQGLYGAGLDPKKCAIVQGANGQGLNFSCEPVRDEICKASADLMGVNRREGRPDLADQTKQRALDFGCPVTMLN